MIGKKTLEYFLTDKMNCVCLSCHTKAGRGLKLGDISVFNRVSTGDKQPVTHLDCASDLHGSSPAHDQHPADLAPCQSLQSRLGDVSLLQIKHQTFFL